MISNSTSQDIGDADSGLHPPRIITQPGSEYSTESRQWQGIPGLECAPNGRLWATWYTGGPGEGPGNHVVLATAKNIDSSWKDPVLVVDPGPARRAFDPCIWHDPKGHLWLFWAQVGETEYYDGRAGVWAVRTDDATVSEPVWSEPIRLSDGIMLNKPTFLSNGDWLFPVAVWFENCKPAVKPEVEPYSGTGILATEDGGESFHWRGILRDVPCRSFDEHMLVERRDGTIWELIRARYGIAQSTSTDKGRTWTRAKACAIEGPNSRFFIRRLQSGALLLVNHDGFGGPRVAPKRSHLTAMLSDDDGRTWIESRLLLDDRERVSYPDGVQAADGSIYIIYDFNRGDRWASGDDREILMAVFAEEDVRAGKLVNPQSRLRQIVSKVPA